MAHPPSVRAEALRLREEEGLGLGKIAERLLVSKGTLSIWLRDVPLGRAVVRARMSAAGGDRRRFVGVSGDDKTHVLKTMSTTDQGEAVRQLALGRLLLHGLHPYVPLRESTTVDILVLGSKAVNKCQCKLMRRRHQGAATMRLGSMCPDESGGRVFRAYRREEVDFYIGYVAESDAFFVIPYDVAAAGRRVLLTVWEAEPPHLGMFDGSPYKNAFHLLA